MEYKRYLDSGGNPDIYIDYVTPEGYGLGDGAKLGQWISSMRKRIKQKDLPEEKVARLKTIGFK